MTINKSKSNVKSEDTLNTNKEVDYSYMKTVSELFPKSKINTTKEYIEGKINK